MKRNFEGKIRPAGEKFRDKISAEKGCDGLMVRNSRMWNMETGATVTGDKVNDILRQIAR